MTSQKEDLIEWAEFTFSNSTTDEIFIDSFDELLESVNEIQAAELGFKPDRMNIFNTESAKDDYPPVSCITIKETAAFTMNIFLLQNGSIIPLHDHRDMHGIIKVIFGSVKITSYTALQDVDFDVPEDIRNTMDGSTRDLFIPVELKMSKTITDKDQSCVLTPTEGNYHEICSVGGTSAIFDILAPPYGEHGCNYYKVLETKNPDSQCKLWLIKEIDEPSFWCK